MSAISSAGSVAASLVHQHRAAPPPPPVTTQPDDGDDDDGSLTVQPKSGNVGGSASGSVNLLA